jgi:hypothetical protein
MNTNLIKYTVTFLVSTSLLAACGGGGSGGSGNNNPPLTSPPPTNQTQVFANGISSSGITFQHLIVNPTQQSEPPTSERGAMIMAEMFGGGVASGDIDNDGDIDLFVVRGDVGPNLLYRNDGNNVFIDIATNSVGLANTKSTNENHRHSGPSFADMDGDGDLDLFIGGLDNDPNFIFQNNGNNTFTDVTMDSADIVAINSVNTISASFGDYDLDGDADMFLTHWGTPRTVGAPGDTEHLWRNDSTGGQIVYTNVSEAAGISPSIIVTSEVDISKGVLGNNHDYTFTPAFVKLNNDEFPDLIVVADFQTTQVFFNNGDGTFSNVTSESTHSNGNPVIKDKNGMGLAIGDYDADGDLDWFVTGIFGEVHQVGNRLYRNDNGVFADVTGTAKVFDGAWGWGACFADFDNDGDLDIYHTNGWRNNNTGNWATDLSRLFISPGGPENLGTFEEKAADWGIQDNEEGRGIVCADFDNDGDTDVFVTHRDPNNSASLYRNDSDDNNWLKVKLVGQAPNTEALGARVIITSGIVTQMREVMAGNNFTSQNPTEQLFGLGTFAQVDTVEVQWPDGSTTVRQNVPANQRLLINQ